MISLATTGFAFFALTSVGAFLFKEEFSMVNYKKLYLTLFNRITDTLNVLEDTIPSPTAYTIRF